MGQNGADMVLIWRFGGSIGEEVGGNRRGKGGVADGRRDAKGSGGGGGGGRRGMSDGVEINRHLPSLRSWKMKRDI